MIKAQVEEMPANETRLHILGNRPLSQFQSRVATAINTSNNVKCSASIKSNYIVLEHRTPLSATTLRTMCTTITNIVGEETTLTHYTENYTTVYDPEQTWQERSYDIHYEDADDQTGYYPV